MAVLFAGAGTRWPAELVKPDHPANGLYWRVREIVQGASGGCATVFSPTESVQAAGVPLVRERALPGTPGVLSLRRDTTEGWNAFVF